MRQLNEAVRLLRAGLLIEDFDGQEGYKWSKEVEAFIRKLRSMGLIR